MKNVLTNTRMLAIAIAASFTTAISAPALANEDKKTIPAELKYLGKIQSQPVFQLNIANTEESQYTIVVRDEDNNILYRDNVKGSNISKKFLLNLEEVGNMKIKFEITGKKSEKTVVYEVNKTSQVVEDVVVSKI